MNPLPPTSLFLQLHETWIRNNYHRRSGKGSPYDRLADTTCLRLICKQRVAQPRYARTRCRILAPALTRRLNSNHHAGIRDWPRRRRGSLTCSRLPTARGLSLAETTGKSCSDRGSSTRPPPPPAFLPISLFLLLSCWRICWEAGGQESKKRKKKKEMPRSLRDAPFPSAGPLPGPWLRNRPCGSDIGRPAITFHSM